jgi:hypothetical protein
MKITKPTLTSPLKLLKQFLAESVSAAISVIELLHLGTQTSLVFGPLSKPHHLVASFISHMTNLQKQSCLTLQICWETQQVIRRVMLLLQMQQRPLVQPWQVLKRESFLI